MHHALTAILRLRDAPLLPDVRLRLALREADLLRRVMPEEALAVLERLDGAGGAVTGTLAPDAIRAHALLDLGRPDEAKTLSPFLAADTDVYALIEGRIAWSEGRLDPAAASFETAIATTTDPEVEAESRMFLVRLRAVRRQPVADALDELEALCARHGAGITQVLVRTLRLTIESGVAPIVAEGLARGARTELSARYTFGVEQDRATLGAIPLEVHGAARKHPDDPDAFASAVLALSALSWATGDHAEGYAVAWYGHTVGARRYGDTPMVHLATYLGELEARVGPDELERLRALLMDPQRSTKRGPTAA
ncbi:MAG: hypothetical protein Q8P41_20320 [Pseudomonadota bacterium]|nr:hypothetical protein [Pseudomonadota bacterium]